MLSSITPLGERSRRQRFGVTVSFLVAGSTAAGALVGALLAAAGRALPPADAVRGTALAAALTLGLVLDLVARPPGHRRQVDERWLRRYRGWVYGAGFGAQLGAGAATIVTTWAVYVAFAAELLAPGVAAGAAIGATFGLARGATVLAGARVDSTARLLSLHRRLRAAERPARLTALAVQAAVAAAVLLAL